MVNVRAPGWAALALLAALASSCGPTRSPLVVEALVPDPGSESGVALGDVELTTIRDVTRGEGELFDITGGVNLDASSIQRSLQGGDDYRTMIDSIRASGGPPVAPRIVHDGTRWVAQDFDALLYLTVLANFEKAWLFFDEVVGDESAATDEKSVVALYASLSVSVIPLLTSDNAAYFPGTDGWIVLRVGLQDGVPLAMSLPVIGHEFQHRVFFQNVFGERNFESFRRMTTATLVEQPDYSDPAFVANLRAHTLVRAVDEGLADVFTIGMNDDVQSIARVFAQSGYVFESEGVRRDLEGEFADVATYESLERGTLDEAMLADCGAAPQGAFDRNTGFSVDDHGNFASGGFNHYCIGTLLARALWDGAGRDGTVLRDQMLTPINRALPKLGDDVAETGTFDVDMLLERIAAELPPGPLLSSVCAGFAEKFGSVMTPARVPTCF